MRRAPRAGMSLVELLVVVAILAALAALSAPAVGDLIGARGTTRALDEISGLLELARNEAMTRQTYAWIGFAAATNALGNDELSAVVLASPDGVVDTSARGTTVSISTARPISRSYRWENVRLAALAELAGLAGRAEESTDALAKRAPQSFVLGEGVPAKSLRVITFTPQGYAVGRGIPELLTPYVKGIDIGLQPTRAGKKIDRPGPAALVLDGLNGRVEILRR